MKYLFTHFLLLLAYIACSQNYEIYVSDAGDFNNIPGQILKFDENGQNPTVFINSNVNWPQDILFLEGTNTVLISNLNSGRIIRHDAATGAYINNFANSISGPTRMKIGSDGLLYVLQWGGNGKVKRYKLDGTYMGEFTSMGVPQSIGIDWDSNGNLYVSSYTGDYVRKFDTQGTNLGLFINTNLQGPTNIWFDPNGDLLVADYDGTAVKRFDSDGNYLGSFMTGLSKCEGVDFFPNGDILIGNGGTSSVKLYDSKGNYIKDLIPGGSGNLINPNAIVIKSVSTTAVKETQEELSTSILFPTIGLEFFIRPQYLDQIEELDIYNTSGSLIRVIETIRNPLTMSSNFVEGLYFVKMRFRDGSIKTEKLIVQK